jgi:hypothetical protein
MSAEVDDFQKQVMARTLLEWLHAKWNEDLISVVDVYQRAPCAFRNKAVATDITQLLEAFEWLIPAGKGIIGGKRRRSTWRIVREPIPR